MEPVPEGPGGNSLKRQVGISEFRGLKLSRLVMSTPRMCLQPKSFRNLGPAHHRLCCRRGLRGPRRCLLQHGRLNLILSLLSNHKANCTLKVN